MIQLHIITKEPSQSKEIVGILIDKKLITGVTVMETVSSYKNDSGVIEEIPTNLIIGRTKAMLFNTIEKLLEDKYGDHMPVIYGMPIVNMDFKHAEKLKEEIRQVDY